MVGAAVEVGFAVDAAAEVVVVGFAVDAAVVAIEVCFGVDVVVVAGLAQLPTTKASISVKLSPTVIHLLFVLTTNLLLMRV
ncbi:MAG: hypothetical protein HYX83_03000 [Chloroflexi bacterium]|nr:hypothetical protein [Chloroflexota bacterium]